MMNKLYAMMCLLLGGALGLHAQDIHYIQFQNAPLYQSPGMTGVMPADFRFSAIYRSQWEWVPVDYKTFGFSYDMKVTESRYGFLGAGLVLNRDQAGDAGLSFTSAMATLAYTLKAGEQSLVTLGFQAGLGQRSFDFLKLTFDQQFNGDQHIPGSDTGEQFERTNLSYFDLGSGLNYRFQISSRSKMDLGVAVHHLNRPNVAFMEQGDIRLSMRVSGYFDGTVQVGKVSDVLFRAVWHSQQPYRQLAMGAGWRHHLSVKKGQASALSFSTMYRIGDALVPMVEWESEQWRLGFSYDVNLSSFRVATNRNGGPELSVNYMIKRPKKKPNYRTCPVL